jgi:hypothetical protein
MQKLKFDKNVRDRFWRAFLRSIPLFPAGPEVYDLLKAVRQSQNDFDQQVTEAAEGLQKTSELITALEQGVKERMSKLEKVRQDYDKYSELAQIESKKAEALVKQIEFALGKEQRKERWIALAMHLGVGFVFFALGVTVSDLFKAWASHIWSMLFH